MGAPETMPTSLAKHRLKKNPISEKIRINTRMSADGNWPSSLTSHSNAAMKVVDI